jgi:predicted component of type VI protein secretion system
MLPLVVHIEKSREARTTRAFHESPVRIGRSPFASLRLREPFVSEWQAVVRFHGDRTTYLDLGSKNPTRIDGRPIERNVEVEIDERTEVSIGTMRLRFQRLAMPANGFEPPRDEETSFVPERFLEPEPPTGTVMVQEHAAAAPHKPPVSSPNRTVAGMPPSPRPRMPAAQHGRDGHLGAAHCAYRMAWTEFLTALKRDVEALPAAARIPRLHALRRRFPELVYEPGFRELAQQAGIDGLRLGHVDVEEWLGRLCGTPAAVPAEHTAVTMERVGHLLELFAAAFIESRRAHQRARQKLALGHGQASTSLLQQSEDPHALLAYLLSSDPNARDRSQELRTSLADFAIHQIALLSAVVEGARSMLAQLEPRALAKLREPEHAAGVLEAESAARVWPFAARKLWHKFVVRHHDLTQTDHFARELFGREFMRRYHAIADSAIQVRAEGHR